MKAIVPVFTLVLLALICIEDATALMNMQHAWSTNCATMGVEPPKLIGGFQLIRLRFESQESNGMTAADAA